MTPEILQAYWEGYLATLPADHPHGALPPPIEHYGFGDSAEMADELGQLVRDGIKGGTTGLLWEYEAEGEPLQQVGDVAIIVDGQNRPLCIVETTQVDVLPLNEVDAQFAYDEGEGDRSLEYWLDAHWRFFTRVCAAIGRTPAENMPVVCERFRLIYPA